MRIITLVVFLVCWVTACDHDNGVSSEDLVVARVSGNHQQGRPGTALANTLVVLVTDRAGQPVANQRVDFSVTQGDAWVTLESTLSDARGLASTQVVLGATAGSVQVQAEVYGSGSAVTFDATATAPTGGSANDSTGTDITTGGEGLVAHLPLDGDARDVSGEGNDGMVHGAIAVADRFGVFNGALRFDGATTWVEVPNSPTLNVHGHTSLTLSTWIRPQSVSGRQGIMNKWGPLMEQDDQFNLRLEGGHLHFELSDEPTDIASVGTVSANAWHLVVGIYDVAAGTTAVYIDGQLDRSQPVVFDIWSTTQYVEIGRDQMSYFRGDIDDVRIYSRALAAAEVGALFGAGR